MGTRRSDRRARSNMSGLARCGLAADLTPALGSALLLALLLSTAPAVVGTSVALSWLAAGASTLSRTGERFIVRTWCGLRHPTARQERQLSALTAAAARLAGVPEAAVDWYVTPTRSVNAYAVGAHSIAVTTGFLRHYTNGAEPPARATVAVLLHDLLTAPVTAMPEMPAA